MEIIRADIVKHEEHGTHRDYLALTVRMRDGKPAQRALLIDETSRWNLYTQAFTEMLDKAVLEEHSHNGDAGLGREPGPGHNED
jgi:hypothetical protein